MGFFSKSFYEGGVIGVAFVGAVFTGFVLRSLLRLVREAKVPVFARDPYVNRQMICACIQKRLDSFQLSKYLTLASVVCSFMGFIISMIYRSLYFCVCDGCAVRSVLFALSVACLTSGYTLTYAAHFERLRLTFRDTPLQLPNWAPKLVYGTCLLFVLLMAATVAFRLVSQPKASSVCVALAFVIYFATVSILTRVFYQKTTAAVNNATSVLLQVAVRITVVVAVSALSTFLTFLMAALVFGFLPMSYFWLTVGRAMIAADQCMNCFCLMCTFTSAVTPYKRVFGCLHSAFLAHVSKNLSVPKIEVSAVLSFTDDTKSHEPVSV